jgi:ABC-type branched-subunit amino acid transport system permease subunit
MRRTPWAIVGVAALLAFVPQLGLPAFYDSLLYLVLHWVVLATSWNILSGYTGYFSFGHGAFFGAGLYTTATLISRFDWPFLATLPVAAGVACVLGLAVGAQAYALVKASSILSVIAGVELTRTSQNIMNVTYRPVEAFCIAAVLYFIVLFSCSLLTRHLERKAEGARA